MHRTLLALALLAPASVQADPAPTVRQTSATYVVTLPAGAALIDDTRLIPLKTGDAVDGLRLSNIATDSVPAQLGLRDGDIVRTIDNRPVVGLESAVAALTTASAGGRLFLHVERDGQRRALTCIIERAATTTAKAAEPEAAPPTTVDWIRPTAPGVFSLHRPGLDAMLADPGALARSARMVPAREGDAFVGFKLYAIRPGSVPAALGLKNGDLLRTVNGLPLANPQQALEAYTRLRKATEVTLVVTRGGQPLTLRYTVDDEVVAPPPSAP